MLLRMLGRIGKRYPRVQTAAQPSGAQGARTRRSGVIGGFIAFLSVLGVLLGGWLLSR
jgi:hypothetical protein